MTFTIRSFLIMTAFVAAWLGVLVSKSATAIEIASYISALLILLTLPMAIWDSRRDMRPFWTGFFVLSAGTYILNSHFSAQQQVNHYLAEVFSGQSVSSTGKTVLWDSTIMMSGRSAFAPRVFNSAGASTLYGAIWDAIPILSSFIMGSLGGWVTLWVARQNSPAAR
jgi:hypothetical protein